MSAVSNLLLTDSTVPFNFSKAGANCAIAMLHYLDDRLHMVVDVHEELVRLASSSPALQRFLDEFPEERIRILSHELIAEVGSVVKAMNPAGLHPKENIGEVASVFYAKHRLDHGETFDVITDDHEGKKLAYDRELKVINTPALVTEMFCAGAIEFADGQRVWQQCFSNPEKWKGFRKRVQRDCPQRLAA